MADAAKTPVKDVEVLLTRIRGAFPGLTWQNYRYNDDGWDHEVVILDERIVFRFPNDDDYRGQLKREIEILRKLSSAVSARIPDYAYIAPDVSFAGYNMIPGEVLTVQKFKMYPEETQAEIIRQLAEFLTQIHRTDHPFMNRLENSMHEYHAELKQQAEQFLKSKLSDQDYRYVQEIIEDTDELLKRNLPATYIHGDLYHNHLLWDEQARKLGVIDFSDMELGDPAKDVSELYEYGKEFARAVYEQYRGPKDNTFLQRAWTYQRWIGVFMMVDHFINDKMPFEDSREIFDRTKTER